MVNFTARINISIIDKTLKYTFITVGINLALAISIFLFLVSNSYNPLHQLVQFLNQFYLNFLVGFLTLFIATYCIGRLLYLLICVKKWNGILTGMFALFIILICGIFGGASVGFIEKVLFDGGAISEALFDYYAKPAYWILLFGSMPTLLSGGILGISIRKICAKKN